MGRQGQGPLNAAYRGEGGSGQPGRVSVNLLQRDRHLLETSVPGVFAVGDVRASSVKRVASAVGEGAIAVQFVHQYLSL